MKKYVLRPLVLILAVVIIVSAAPCGAYALGLSLEASHGPYYILACSDFQPRDDNVFVGISTMSKIFQQVEAAGYTAMDGFMCLGDYSQGYVNNVDKSRTGLNAVQTFAKWFLGEETQQFYVQGNHDPDSMVGNELIASGENDTEGYGVFVINEMDYMWFNSDEATIKRTADRLKAYLDGKIERGYDKPVFVVSHLPLHYSMRTYTEGDGKYANYLFDVLNAAGKSGLNIFFLYGHNHARGWDDYMGGASVYLEPGDTIHIARSSQVDFTTETLTFTYMNAGYVGYYTQNNSEVDGAMTMTVFTVTDNDVKVERYSAEGLHPLKSPGVYGADEHSEYETTAYKPNTAEYEGTRSHTLRRYGSVSDLNVTATGFGLTSLSVDRKEQERVGYRKYVEYDITVEGLAEGGNVWATIELDEGFDIDLPVTVLDLDTGTLVSRKIDQGAVTVTFKRKGRYALIQVIRSETVTQSVDIPAYKVFEPVTELESGQFYAVVSAQSGYALTNQCVDDRMVLDSAESTRYDHLWYYERVAEWGMVNRYLRSPIDGSYLSLQKYEKATLMTTPQNLVLTVNNNGSWTIQQERFLSQSDPSATMAGTTQKSSLGNYWLFGKVEEIPARSYSLSVATGGLSLDVGRSYELVPTVTENGVTADRYELEWSSSDPSVACVENGTLRILSVGMARVTATLVSVNGETLDAQRRPQVQIQAVIAEKHALSAVLDQDTATVAYGVSSGEKIGAFTVTYDDGSTERVDVTASMLEGSYNLRRTGTYKNLSIRWQGLVVTEQFTLTVTAEDYPLFPHPGGVRVSKTVTSVDTSLSGLSIVEISMAGMNARLDGEMGTEYLTPVSRAILTDALEDAFTLMRADHQYFVEENGRTVIKNMKMSVVVRSYELYAPEDVDGVTVTEDMVGSRKGEGTVLETITFGANGYSAYSDRIPGNIMPEGILDAQTFIYNSLAMQILWDVGNADGAYSTIGANTIYWKIGALQNTEVTMTYYAYLTGSVEGTRETGEYALSKGTAVVYDGWTGNACWQTVEIPSVSWTQSTEKNGVYGDYFYVDGVRQKPYRLFEYDGHYYFVNDGDRIAKNVAQYIFPHSLEGVTLPDGSPFPEGLYHFDSEGRMIDPPIQEPETEAPTEPGTEAPTEPETEAPTEPETEAPTEPGTEAPTEPGTEAPTEPETEAPTEPGTEAPTEPGTEVPGKGCGSAISVCTCVLLPAVAAAVTRLRKRETEIVSRGK